MHAIAASYTVCMRSGGARRPAPALRDLRAFVSVVDEGTFTDAAIALGTTQATVSRQVAALERALDARLLLRGGRSVGLTTTGRGVLRHARAISDEIAAMHRVVADERREVRVGYSWAALGAHTGDVQRQWAREHPGSELIFVNSSTHLAGLSEGRADAVVVRRDPGIAAVQTALLGLEERVAALPSEHPLARKRSLRMADFAGERVALNSLTGTTTPALWTPPASPGSFREVEGTDEWLTVIAAGQALGLSSQATSVQYPRAGITFRPVVDAPPLQVWLAWWRNDPPWFIDELRLIIRDQYETGG